MQKKPSTPPTIALVYDRLNTRYGGAEYLLKLFLEAFPQAPIFTSVYHPQATWAPPARVKTSFLQKLGLARWHQWLTPLMPLAFESLDLSSFDVIISITSAEAKGVLTKPNQLHLSYIFSPTKYLYEYQEKYDQDKSVFGSLLLKPFINLTKKYLSWWDKTAVLRADKIFTLSQISAQKIKKVYGLTSEVIYPPIRFFAKPKNANISSTLQNFPPFLLSVSRLVSYKRVDLAMQVAINRHQPLIIIGEGVNKNSLVKLHPKLTYVRSGQTSLDKALTASRDKLLIFLGQCSDGEYLTLTKHAQAVLVLGDEDFGLVPLEALSIGTPVVISLKSGAAELAAHQRGVAVFDPHDPTAINELIDNLPKKVCLNPNLVTQLQPARFIKIWQSLVQREWRKHLLL